MKTNKYLFVILISFLFFGYSYGQQYIVGYAPYYRTYHQNFDFGKFTHVHFFSVFPTAEGGLAWPKNQDSISMYNKYLDVYRRSKDAGSKVILTFGGIAENGSKHFATMAKNDISRAKFVSNAINICKVWKADGLDIDWENNERPLPQEDMDAYTDLMTDLRIAADANNLSLSTDVSSSAWFGINQPVEAVDQAHYINVMTYSYNGSWSPSAKHHTDITTSVNQGLGYWTNQGISKSKLNLGVAFYGVRYKGASAPGQPFNSTDYRTFTQVEALIDSGYTVVENNENGTYCFSEATNEIIFYDSPANVANKINFTKTNGYGGVIIWEIGQDNLQQTLATAVATGNTGNLLPVANANGPYTAAMNETITFSSAGSNDPDGSITSYSWDFGDGATSTQNNPDHSYSTSGVFTVTLQVSDDAGSTASATATVTIADPNGCTAAHYTQGGGYVAGSQVQNNGTLYECKPFPFSGWCNGAAWAYAPGTGTYWSSAWTAIGPCQSSKTTSLNTSAYTLYPNPIIDTNEIHLKVSKTSNASIILYNQIGQRITSIVSHKELAQGTHTFAIGNSLKTGIYFVKVTIDGQEEIIKILKR